MADNGSLAKYNEQRAAEYAAKRAALGLPPRKKQKPYIDETMTPEMREYDRAVREAARERELNRRRRMFAREDACKRLAADIERLSVNPFTQLVNR